MDLILQKELPHQQRAVDAACSVLRDVEIKRPVQFYENPLVRLNDPMIRQNIDSIQSNPDNGVQSGCRGFTDRGHFLGLDIKMETGTGKTYVYTKIMYEFHKQYVFNKFVIFVPSLAVKAGTLQFLKEEYVRRHFRDVCGYDADLEVCILKAVKKKKKGRIYFPSAVGDFIRGSCQSTKKIYVLVCNMQLLTGSPMLTRCDYEDYGVEGFHCPVEAISATRPVILIDEPHRFSREQKAYKMITDEMRPQMLMRFGATFPEITEGRGRNKHTVKDYQNLLYDLNACSAFHQNLVKGVAKEHFESSGGCEEKVKILSVRKNDAAVFQYRKKGAKTEVYRLQPGESLSVIANAFHGITLRQVSASGVVFSNGIEKSVGEEMNVEIYMTSYQEEMMRLALQRHFETERENFSGRIFRMKTLALFFIDDITSYRVGNDGKLPYLLIAFERLLRERIEKTLSDLDRHESAYREYLEASLADIPACHGGYFSQDNSDTDEDIAREVDMILHDKKQLLSFVKPDGSYHTLRFLFSKWTLKEGWDNPNVFTIVKLRSSGSDISRLQEVGRGLRLPVDENGNRIANEEFYLNYIVDFTEADFACKLVEQINGEMPSAAVITEAHLKNVAGKRGITADELFDVLYRNGFIDRNKFIKPELQEEFYEKFPEFLVGSVAGRVKDRNITAKKPVKIRADVYEEMRLLWETINQRCALVYESISEEALDRAIETIFEEGVFAEMSVSSLREIVVSDDGQMRVELATGVQYNTTYPVPYGEFLRRISESTNLPVTAIHRGMVAYAAKHGEIRAEQLNESSVALFTKRFTVWKNTYMTDRFHYIKYSTQSAATALTYADGSPRDRIAQGRIGIRIKEGVPGDKYLYDTFAYDSPLELENMLADMDEVVVYGKIPRCSISIPTITGGMYSPDFMYIVRKKDGGRELNIIVETKDVKGKEALRGEEGLRLKSAEVFFETICQDGYDVRFHIQMNNQKIKQIIDGALDREVGETVPKKD